MPVFHELLTSAPDEVVDVFYSNDIDMSSTPEEIATHLKLNESQLICALGFNHRISDLLDIIFILGYESIDDFLKKRNRLFVSDIYQQLSLKQILSIYDQLLNIPQDIPKNISENDQKKSDRFTAKLIAKRVERLEQKIEKTVKPKLIENYRKEMKAIYKTGSVPAEFVTLRIENSENGFRALLDEINLIADSKVFSIEEIFLHDSVLPEEKRRLISRNLVPRELVKERMKSEKISDSEREILENYL